MEYKILINNEDVTDFVPFPLSSQFSLDESLDMGNLRLQYTSIAEPFKPFTTCDIIIDNVEHNFFISSDEVTEAIQVGVYNHSLLLIEQSKWLERFTGIVKTNTTPIAKNYESITPVHVPVMVEYADSESQFEWLGEKKTGSRGRLPLLPCFIKNYTLKNIVLLRDRNNILPQN